MCINIYPLGLLKVSHVEKVPTLRRRGVRVLSNKHTLKGYNGEIRKGSKLFVQSHF
jgi:hypothetical protein